MRGFAVLVITFAVCSAAPTEKRLKKSYVNFTQDGVEAGASSFVHQTRQNPSHQHQSDQAAAFSGSHAATYNSYGGYNPGAAAVAGSHAVSFGTGYHSPSLSHAGALSSSINVPGYSSSISGAHAASFGYPAHLGHNAQLGYNTYPAATGYSAQIGQAPGGHQFGQRLQAAHSGAFAGNSNEGAAAGSVAHITQY